MRRETRTIQIGDVMIGSGHPIPVQTMTKTDTRDSDATINQINDISAEGADIVRVSCPDKESTFALKEIIKPVSYTHLTLPTKA